MDGIKYNNYSNNNNNNVKQREFYMPLKFDTSKYYISLRPGAEIRSIGQLLLLPPKRNI